MIRSSVEIHRDGSVVPGSSIESARPACRSSARNASIGPGELGRGQIAQQSQMFGHLVDGARRPAQTPQAILDPADRLRVEPVVEPAAAQAAVRAGLRRRPKPPAGDRCVSARPTRTDGPP